MNYSIVSLLLLGLAIIALSVAGIICYRKRRTKKRAKTRLQNNSWYKLRRSFVNTFLVGVILSTIVAIYIGTTEYFAIGYWRIEVFLFGILTGAFTLGLLGWGFSPIFGRIKRNVLVKNQDHSLYSLFKTLIKIIISAGPVILALTLGALNISKGLADVIIFFGVIFSTIISSIFLKRRSNLIEKGIREGCKNNPNVVSVWHNNITEHDIMDCVSCDSVLMKKNFVIKHDKTDVGFSAVDFKNIVGKNNASTHDPAEVVHYKITKQCKHPIICTFDNEMTDSPMPIVETENPTFNKEFTTLCENAEDAFYILTPQIMEKMLEAQKLYKRLIFNFDGNDLFIIIYHNKFLDSLAKKDSNSAFNDLKTMLDNLIFDGLAMAGAHEKGTPLSKDEPESEKAKKPKSWETQSGVKFSAVQTTSKGKKALIIISAIIGIFILGNIVIFGVAHCSIINPNYSSVNSDKATNDDTLKLSNYLTNKYGQQFSVPENGFSNRIESQFSTSVYIDFIDANNYKFEAKFYSYTNDGKIEFSDDYQTSQYDRIIEKQILATNSNIQEVYFHSGSFNEKFSSVEDMLNRASNLYCSIDLTSDFGQVNQDTCLVLSKQIIEAIHAKDISIYFYEANQFKSTVAYRYKDGEYSLF